MRYAIAALSLAALGIPTGGCALLAGAGLGVMAHDEATENDGEFDPLEEVEDDIDDDDGN